MSIRKAVLVMGLSVLLGGCSTGGYLGDGFGSSPSKLGVRYLLGRGVPQNDQKAFYYFNQAAEAGDPLAQNEVAYLYAAGKGTPRNYPKALFWYEKAANHGLASAAYNLGLMYLHGLGTPANKAKATEWFKVSAAKGFEPAREALK